MADAPDILDDLDSPDESTVMAAAIVQVKILTRAADRYRRLTRLLVAVLIALAAVTGGLGYLEAQQKQDAINACRGGNSYRMAQSQIWDKFIDLITEGNHDPAVLAKARAFDGYVARTDALNDCQRLYGAF